ncbi:MAG: protein-disulfide reductase DsbD, partial [Gammaproteobacteria bacterium]|nr:protein-disulfide reductase DsbD [Gammaproteobacteria bacterium]
FRYDISVAGDEVIVLWDIEPGHYLYKERMSYASRSVDVTFGDAALPKGKPYTDEFFGDMHIYRESAEIRIPIVARPAGVTELEVELKSQGCADIGLCYPPQTWTANVTLPASGDPGGPSPLARLMSGATAGADEPLPPEQAFRPLVDVVDPFNLRVEWTIEDGYYLYRDSLKVSSSGNAAAVGPPNLPAGTTTWDEHFGETQVFYSSVVIDVPLSRSTPSAGSLPLVLDYQGCKTDSICYPPEKVELIVDLPSASAADQPRDIAPAEEMVSEQDKLANLIVNGNLLLVLASFAGAGLLLAFTPCVLPMVPILSGIVAGQGKDVTQGRAFALSLTYVLGMALTYTAAGAAAGAAGAQVQAMLQKPWIIIGVAGLFVALAMSMFGFYELQMPSAIQNRLTKVSNQQKTGTFVGTAVMGMLSALVVTTCVAPPLVAVMTVIAETGDITRGALSLFAMSMGMGLPLLVIGTSAGKLLPKAGAWMNKVKGAFGFMMLGLAIWMLGRLLPGAVTMAMWAALVFMAGVFLGAFQSLGDTATSGQKFAKGTGLLASLYGAALLIGALNGQTNPLQPLRFGSSAQEVAELEFTRIKSVQDLEIELQQAAAAGQTVMLDFYADWCVSCKEMEHYTFTDAAVQDNLRNTLLLQADVTANDELDQALLQHFGIFGPPTIMFFDTSGSERTNYRVVGFMPADEFSSHIVSAFAGNPAPRISDNIQ